MTLEHCDTLARRVLLTALALSIGWSGAPSALAQTGVAPPAAIALPSLGDEAAEDFSVITEARLGERILREVRRDPAYLDDPELLEYVQGLWQPLMAAARRKGEIPSDLDARFAWEVFLVRDRSVNAFALPGGTVGTHLGLIALTQTPDELASVLAHELSHVTQRHIARSFANSRRQSMMAVAGMILGVLAASRANSPDGVSAAIVGSQAASVQGQLNFSRDMEREADRVGFSVLTQAGFAPLGMAAMFERLQAASRLNDSGGFPYLRTHPLTGERVAEARARVGLGALAAAPSTPSSPSTAGLPDAAAQALATVPLDAALLHAVAVARARVLADARDEALARWAAGAEAGGGVGGSTGTGMAPPSGSSPGSADGSPPTATPSPRPGSTAALAERLTGAYSVALAASMRRDAARAEAGLRDARAVLAEATAALRAGASGPAGGARSAPSARAADLAPVQRALALLAAELAVARGDGAAALAALAPLSTSGTRVVLLRRAEATLAHADASPAALRERGEALQTWLSSHPADAMAWGLSAQVWQRLGQPLRALRAEAEARYALGDLAGASDRLRAGQQLARRTPLDAVDAIESSVIDTRLREVDELRRQIFLEERGNAGR